MKLYYIYVSDLFFKLIYCLISFLFTFIICFTNINNFFLFEIMPFLKIFYYKRFIITQINQLFNVVWTLSFFYGSIFIYPLVILKYLIYFKSSWFSGQKNLYKFFLYFSFINYIIFFFFCHLNIVPFILNFFLSWELIDKSYLLRIETEISFYYYLFWLISLKNSLSLVMVCMCNFFLAIFSLKKILFLHYFFRHYKNSLGFVIITLIYFLIPPDFIIQFLLFLFIYFIIELFFLFFCILLYKYLKIIRCLQ